jgi:hypothetical protein
VSYELLDNIEILRLTGSAPIAARGNDLDNTVDGTLNLASNVLSGGLGNDRYVVNANDSIVERAGEGIDTVEWHGTGTRAYTAADLPAEVEGMAFGDDLGDAGYAGNARFDRVTGNAVPMGEAAGVASAASLKQSRMPHELAWSQVERS